MTGTYWVYGNGWELVPILKSESHSFWIPPLHWSGISKTSWVDSLRSGEDRWLSEVTLVASFEVLVCERRRLLREGVWELSHQSVPSCSLCLCVVIREKTSGKENRIQCHDNGRRKRLKLWEVRLLFGEQKDIPHKKMSLKQKTRLVVPEPMKGTMSYIQASCQGSWHA